MGGGGGGGSELENKTYIICMMLHMENVEYQTDHFANAFVRENVAYGYDVVTTL